MRDVGTDALAMVSSFLQYDQDCSILSTPGRQCDSNSTNKASNKTSDHTSHSHLIVHRESEMFIQKYQCPLMSFENSPVHRCVVDLGGEYINRTGFPTPAFLASGIILVVFICLDSFNQILRIKMYKYYVIHICHIFCVLRAKD